MPFLLFFNLLLFYIPILCVTAQHPFVRFKLFQFISQMSSSGNWLKLLIPHRKSNPNDREKDLGGKKNKKWKLWRSSSSSSSSDQTRLSVKRGQVAASEPPSDLPLVDVVYSAAMATLVRSTPKNFLIIRQEWAAIRIQTAFRALLARRALRALKALVRLQAIVRGRLVRKQAAMTLKCMQALVRAQAHITANRAKIIQNKLENQSETVKQEEGKWYDRKQQQIKREKAMAYFISQQQQQSGSSSPNIKTKGKKKGTTSSNSYCSSSRSQPSTSKMSSSTTAAYEGSEDTASSGASVSKPRYMSVTASNRAKHREGISKSRLNPPSLAQHYAKSGMRLSGEMTRISVDSALNPPPKLSLNRYYR